MNRARMVVSMSVGMVRPLMSHLKARDQCPQGHHRGCQYAGLGHSHEAKLVEADEGPMGFVPLEGDFKRSNGDLRSTWQGNTAKATGPPH
jgi:hypothetical protein